MEIITEEILLKELRSWEHNYKNGRDEHDQRFGQHIWNNYDLDAVFPERDAGSDGFNEENAYLAYAIICAKIIENNIKSN